MVPQVVPQKLGLPGGNSGDGRGTPSIWPSEGDDHHAFHEDAKPGDLAGQLGLSHGHDSRIEQAIRAQRGRAASASIRLRPATARHMLIQEAQECPVAVDLVVPVPEAVTFVRVDDIFHRNAVGAHGLDDLV